MIVSHLDQLDAKAINHPEVKHVLMKVLVSPKEGWDGYVMRVFEVGVDGYTPRHAHPWPHINYIIEGKGELMVNHKINAIEAGSFAYVPSDTLHQFKNVGQTPLKFICIVPEEGHR